MTRPTFAGLRIVWGRDDTVADVGALTDGIRILGAAGIARRAVDGAVNRTADGVSAGYGAVLVARAGDAVDMIEANPAGVLGVRISDTAAYALPVLVESIRATAPAANLQGVEITLLPDLSDPSRYAAYGAPVTAAQLAVPAGGAGWIFAADGVDHVTAATAVAADPAWGVASLPLLAEGVTPR